MGDKNIATSTSQCIDEFPVFSIDQAKGLFNGGIIGLTPTCQGTDLCMPYVQGLFEQGTIPEPVISFNMGQKSFWLQNMSASI